MQRYDSESNSQLKVNRTPRTANIRKNLYNLPFVQFGVSSPEKAKKHIFYFIVHSLIAFENRIRLSVDSLILSADTLIVAELMIRKAEAKRIHSPPLLCFRAVTSSRCHTSIITNWKHACCAGDNSVTTKSKHKSLPHV